MPIIKSAIKKLRQDKKRRQVNLKSIGKFKVTLKKARLETTAENVKNAYRAIDTMAKKKIFHKNKAARLKSRLAKKMASTKKKK